MTTWTEAADKVIAQQRKWKRQNPEAYERQQNYYAMRLEKEREAARNFQDTSKSLANEKWLGENGYLS